MRPSFLYCSMGNQNRSLTPWTGQTQRDGKERVNKDMTQDKEHRNVKLTLVCLKQTQAASTHIAGQLSAWGQRLPECPAAGSS